MLFIDCSVESRSNNFLYVGSSGFDKIDFSHRKPKALAWSCNPASAITASISAQYFVITQAIIHKYTYDNYGFNSDEELINILLKIILTILRDKD